jgi:predicted dienelactone hydrolase
VHRLRSLELWLALIACIPSGCVLLAAPARPPAGSESAQRLAPGPFAVATEDFSLIDSSRGGRELETTLWFPHAADGAHPLVVYSHGFLSSREGGAYLAEDLASRGYVVVAADFPFTRLGAPGGPRVEDVIHQPADVSFLIDRVLAMSSDERPYAGTIDRERIGVVGLSLGGMTTTLVAFHPRLRDPRIKAAVSIAGPMDIFTSKLFETARVPFLMIAGSFDVVIDYPENATLVLERVPGGELVTIAGASHTGFDDGASGVLRVLDNPDDLACWILPWTLRIPRDPQSLAALGFSTDGVEVSASRPEPCTDQPLGWAMDPLRQQMITRLAITAFFESQLALDPDMRQANATYLSRILSTDFPEVVWAQARPRSE